MKKKLSSGKLEKFFSKATESSHGFISNVNIEISQLVIPFSKICKSYKRADIYSGSEKIPFKERDSEYKMILRQEFVNTFNFKFKVFKSVIKFPSL